MDLETNYYRSDRKRNELNMTNLTEKMVTPSTVKGKSSKKIRREAKR